MAPKGNTKPHEPALFRWVLLDGNGKHRGEVIAPNREAAHAHFMQVRKSKGLRRWSLPDSYRIKAREQWREEPDARDRRIAQELERIRGLARAEQERRDLTKPKRPRAGVVLFAMEVIREPDGTVRLFCDQPNLAMDSGEYAKCTLLLQGRALEMAMQCCRKDP